MAEGPSLTVGRRVEVTGKGTIGTVAYIGSTDFSAGKWIGVVLDEPKGKNNGVVQGKKYFECPESHGIFVRQSQLTLVDEQPKKSPAHKPTETPPSAGSADSKLKSRLRVSSTPISKSKPMSQAQRRNQLTRLPVAGGRGESKEANKSLTSTPSGSKSNLANLPSKLNSGGNKRSSFVETGFSNDTIVPVYTPGTPASALVTPVSTPFPSGSEERFGTTNIYDSLRNENKDLSEKLETLKIKRAEDKEKLKELTSMRLQLETLAEFKTKVLESQAALQRDLKKAKNEAREAIEAKDRHAEEMAEFSETIEMATLDKEMAEEKAENVQLELDQANEKVSQLETELLTYKEQLTAPPNLITNEGTTLQVKQLQAENTRLREAIVKLRDASASEKHQHQKTQKEAETLKAEVAELSRTKERLQTQTEELEIQIVELQELNDAALGAEEMVENLTEKNLNLEEKVGQLQESVKDLEELQEVNDQLQESSRELEMELRDDLQKATFAIQNVSREKEALHETVADREGTIIRFRDLVQKLREENLLMRKNLEEESSKSIPGIAELDDFKKMFAETKAQTTAIDLELRRLEAKEAISHVSYLSAFMPEGFMKRGGDNDALLVLLLVPRLICKSELLLSQVREKLIPAGLADGVPSGECVASSPDVERYAFCSQLSFLLYTLVGELHRWNNALQTCNPDDFLKVGVLHSDLTIQEKGLDFYLELLRKSQLDENIPLKGLEKCITVFQNLYSTYLSEEQVEAGSLVSDLCLATVAASDCIVVDVNRLINILKSEKESSLATLLQDVKTIGESLRQLSKRTRRYLPELPRQPPVSNKLQSQLLNDSVTLTKIVKILQEACKQAVNHAGMLSGNEAVPSYKMEEFLQAAMEKCESRVEGGGGFKEVVKEWLTTSLMTMTDLAQVVNEASVIPKEKPPTPLSLRAQAVKAELDQTRYLKVQLEDRDAAINELRKAIRMKQDELSEASIRKELAEKKLSNLSQDNKLTIEKLTRKLEDTLQTLQRKEKEFQAMYLQFQQDIEALESEKEELKEIRVSTSKQIFLEKIARSGASTPIQSPSRTSLPTSHLSSSGGTFTNEGLVEYTRYLQKENWRLKSDEVVGTFKKLAPIDLPKKTDSKVKEMEKELFDLKLENVKLIGEKLKINSDGKLSSARKEYYLGINEIETGKLNQRIAQLKHQINMKLADQNSISVVKGDFAAFSKTSGKESGEIIKIGSLKFPGWETTKGEPGKLILNEGEFRDLHRNILNLVVN